MKIAIIGSGTMGQLFGAKLAKDNDVTMVLRREELKDLIEKEGIILKEKDEEIIVKVKATVKPTGHFDLIILFTKAYDALNALNMHKDIIDDNTIVLSLMNGAGYKEILPERSLLGITQDGAYRTKENYVVHSGKGLTTFGRSDGNNDGLQEIVKVFKQAGFECELAENINHSIWNKLMINASSSVLSGVLGVKQGDVYTNSYAFEICKDLIKEICIAAKAEGLYFNTEEQIERIKNHLINNPDGYTSIYSDLKNGRKTEVDYITGAVYNTGLKHGIELKTHKLMLNMVKAMEK